MNQQTPNAFQNRGARRAQMAQVRGQERTSTWNKYYSRVAYAFTRTSTGGGTTFTYTVNSGTERSAFGYAIGQDMATAGLSGTTATAADTNLVKAAETIAGENLLVYGVSIYLTEDSDVELAKALWPLTSVTLQMNGGQENFRLGLPAMIPCAGGLTGIGNTKVRTPALNESYVSRSGAVSNGAPFVENFLPFPQPIYWTNGGERDSNLVLRFRNERAVAVVSETQDRAAAAGVSAWTAAADGVTVQFIVHLHSRQLSARSVNS